MVMLTSSTACRVRRDSALPILKCLVSPSVRSSSVLASAIDGPLPRSCRKHRTSVASTRYRSGGSISQRAITLGQRGANRQPGGMLARSGGLPGMPVSGTRGPRIDGNASSRPML